VVVFLHCREKIVDGRLSKFASERSLLEQSFIKDTKITVGQHIKETIAKLGETLLPYSAHHRSLERLQTASSSDRSLSQSARQYGGDTCSCAEI